MAKFFNVAIGFTGKTVPFSELQKAFGADGWARYAPNCWIVFTNDAPQAIATRLRAMCSETDSIFVVELNIEIKGGYLQKEIWDWIKRTTPAK